MGHYKIAAIVYMPVIYYERLEKSIPVNVMVYTKDTNIIKIATNTSITSY